MRTTIGATLVVATALAIGAIAVVRNQQHRLTHVVETDARLRADDVASSLRDGLPTTIAVPSQDESFVQIVDASGSVVRSSENLRGQPAVATFGADRSGVSARTVSNLAIADDAFRVVARPASAPTGDYVVYAGVSLEAATEGVHALSSTLAVGLPLLVLLVAMTTWFVTGRALRPVTKLRREVEAIPGRDLDRRVTEPGTGDEVDRLARTMNAMLARAARASEQQRRFVADASHELRSPLTGIRTELEVELAHPDASANGQVEARVLDEVKRLQRLVDDLLVLARSDEPHPALATRQAVDLDDIVLAEVRRLRTRDAVEVDASGVSAAQVVGDADAMLRVVRNLLDNAEHHASARVRVAVTEHPDQVELVVADDGPGVPPELRAQVFERFARADEARDRDHGGAGLGLAIAREITEAHGGTIAIADGAGGGATFVVTFPSASPSGP